MSAVELLQSNLQLLVNANTQESDSFASSLGINLEDLLSEPIQYREVLNNFLKKFELSLPAIMVANFQPVQLAQFKKSETESVSNKLLENLKTIGHYYREQQILKDDVTVTFVDYRHITNMKELIAKVFSDLNFDVYRSRLYSADPSTMNFVLKDLVNDIEGVYGLKVFFTDKDKSGFNFDGVYFNKPIATAYIDAHSSFYTKAIFTMLHELYHFLQDDGETFTFDLFDMDLMSSEQQSEDIKANRFASEFLLFNSSDDLTSLLTNCDTESLKDFLKKYSISREALYFATNKQIVRTTKVGRQPKAYFPYAKTSIKELLQWQYDNTYISIRMQSKLLGSIG